MTITPTVGRVVWYWPDPSEPSICTGGDQPLAALIAHVWSDTCVNIAGFDANGIPFNRTSVLLVQDGNPRPEHQFVEWMPYQKGQAAKTEAAEAKAARG